MAYYAFSSNLKFTIKNLKENMFLFMKVINLLHRIMYCPSKIIELHLLN